MGIFAVLVPSYHPEMMHELLGSKSKGTAQAAPLFKT